MNDGIKLSIIIPCYNEEEELPLTLEKLKTLSNEWSSRDDCESLEFLFVDVGSQYRTADCWQKQQLHLNNLKLFISPETSDIKLLC